jgi:hypothetical protein
MSIFVYWTSNYFDAKAVKAMEKAVLEELKPKRIRKARSFATC